MRIRTLLLLLLSASSISAQTFPVGKWTKLANSTALQGTVNHCPANDYGGFGYNFSNSCQGMMKAWAAFGYAATVDGGCMIEAGGGHVDYAGNELYELCPAFNNGTGQAPGRKLRLTNPSQPAASPCVNTDPLSNPTEPNQGHSYQFFVVAPNVNKLFRWAVGAGDTGGNFCSTYKLWALDLTTVGASCNAETSSGCSPSWTNLTPANLPTTMVSLAAHAAYNHVDGKIYTWQGADHTNSASLSIYDPVANLWTDRVGGPGGSTDIYQNIVIDEKQDLALIIGDFTGAGASAVPFWFDLTGSDSYATHRPTVDATCNNVNGYAAPGIDWDSKRNVIVAYTGQDNTIYYVHINRTANTLTCTSISSGSTVGTDYPYLIGTDIHGTSAPSGAGVEGGVLGRFHYDEVNDLYVVDDAWADPAWVFKPTPMVTLTNPGTAITSQTYSIPVIAAQGEIPNFPQAMVNGTLLTTQADVKNRWPDGSWKYGIASFITSIAASGFIDISFLNQASGNNTGQETIANMLVNYNFNGTINLVGTSSPSASARTILTAAQSGSGCAAPSGGDIDGAIATSGHLCTYWLEGPIVTAVILEDRIGRSYDMNPNSDTGSAPLHPSFEAWFYPSTSQALLGYTLENAWASTTTTSSARDQTAALTLKYGNSSPTTLVSYASSTITPRTGFHQFWCINGTGVGTRDRCGPTVHIDFKLGNIAKAGLLPNWDSALPITPSLITAQVTSFASSNQNPVGTTAGIGFYPVNFNQTGGAAYHGPLPTWSILYLMTMCDPGSSTTALCGNGSNGDLLSVMLHNSDLGWGIPYFFREADSNAGHGQTFDNSGIPGNVQTQGRVVSINARTQVELTDVAQDQGSCNTNYTADWINFGGAAGQDFGAWKDPSNGPQLDPSHWPNLAYPSYLVTGEYGYYEEQVLQSAYAQGSMGAPGSTRACINASAGSSRMGSAGYWDIADNPDRLADWQGREVAFGATIAVDGSPEKAYLLDKVKANIARWEGCQGIANDVTGYTTAYNFGVSPSSGNPGCAPGSLGNFIEQYPGTYHVTDVGDLNTTGGNVAQNLNAHFQNAYSTMMLGWFNKLGFCPGSCVLLQNVENYYINLVMDPASPGMFTLSDYVFPTRNSSNTTITSWAQMTSLYSAPTASWTACSSAGIDEGYAWEGMAALSWGYGLISNEGYSGIAAYNKVHNTIGCISKYWLAPNVPYTAGDNFSDASPKWAMTPLLLSQPVSNPVATQPSCTPGSGTYSSTQSVTCTNPNSGMTIICYTTNGTTPSTNGLGTSCPTGTAYTTPISIPSTSTLQVIAGVSGDTDSSIASYTYTINTSTTAYGLTFSSTHPRLFWTPSRITTANTWVTNTAYPAVTVDSRPLDYYDLAFACFIMNNSTSCSTVITDAMNLVPTTGSGTGVGDDNMRRNGEWIMLVLDWLAPGCGKIQCLTSTQVTTLITNWNLWQGNQDNVTQTWGNVGMPANNYFCGYFRNDFDFGIASYGNNTSADSFLQYGAVNRWNDLLNFASPTGTGKNGRKGYALTAQEGGGEYGRYCLDYFALSLASSAILGRDMWAETTAMKAGVFQTIYNTMPTPTTNRGAKNDLQLFSWADDENWVNGATCQQQSHNGTGNSCEAQSQYYGDFMQAAATEFPSIGVGKLARQWISTVTPAIGPIFSSIDPGGSTQPYTTLPLDYYSSGAQYMYSRSDWTTNATAMLWQMGLNQGGNPSPTSSIGTGHYHQDAGTFQVFRKGINIIRETPAYSETVAGYGGVGTVDAAIGFAHNIPLVGGLPSINVLQGCADGPGVVKRLETNPNYSFAVTDLTLTYENNICDSGHPTRENSHVVSLVREYIYFRSINVLVILDRFQNDLATTSTTFVSHCETLPQVHAGATTSVQCVDGTQTAAYSGLIPVGTVGLGSGLTLVAENANSATAANWQYRIEANNLNPGNVVSYNLYTIQFGDTSGFTQLFPTVSDSAPGTPSTGTFTITIDANNSLILNKGTTSSGGTITAANATNPLTNLVGVMTITDAAPIWGSGTYGITGAANITGSGKVN